MATLFAELTTLEWIYLALFTAGLIYALFLAIFGFGHGSGLEHADLGHAADLGHGVDLGHAADLGDIGHGMALGDVGDVGHGLELGDVGHGVDLGDVGHGGDLGDVGHVGHGDVGLDHGDVHLDAEHGDLGISDHAAPVHASPWNPLVIASFIGGVGGFGILGTRLLGFQSLFSLVIALPAGLVLAGIIFGLYVLLISQAGGSSAATWQDIRGAPGWVVTPIPATGLGEVSYVARGSRFTAAARSVDGRAIPKDTRITVLDVEAAAVVVDVRFAD